jgi:hypothetical protein
MIVKIDINELDSLRKICALASVRCHVFTWTAQYSQVELTEMDGAELAPADAWSICRSFSMELQIQESKKNRSICDISTSTCGREN